MIPAIAFKNLWTEKAEATILKSLAYFDIFNYPLSEDEIRNFMGFYCNESDFRLAIRKLVFSKIIFKFDEFYTLQNDPQVVQRRRNGNNRAKKLLPRAARIGSFLCRFPYVKAVAVSGSLSKNYADKKADIDFFIITKENRLWIARTFLHLFKKFTFLLGRQHYYCMNYFIDEKAMIIQDRNIYSAIEVVTLLPIAGQVLNNFFKINDWTEEWLPCFAAQNNLPKQKKSFFFTKMAEKIFDQGRGDRLDDFLFKLTTQRWQNKEKRGQKNLKGKIMNIVTGKHFSRSNPEAFQEKIVATYENKIDQLKKQWPQYFD
jgi:hypothetical protein